ncbi:hypothetical protein IWW45_001645 [Coemansia sp. RSA 485]|nr:hypothetical protein IWW45_001645 [Coemansia sp. RSA 485]
MSQNKDKGFDDCPLSTAMPFATRSSLLSASPFSTLKDVFSRQTAALSTRPHGIFGSTVAIADTDEKMAMDSLALLLKTSANPHACTHLAIMLLSHVPADMLKLAMQQLDLLLRRDFIGALPMEIATQILEYLPAKDIAQSVSLVNRRWHAIATQPCLWRKLYRRHGWKVDRQRWEFYYALPRSISPSRMLLDSAVFQVSRALAIAANLAVAPSSQTASATDGDGGSRVVRTATATATAIATEIAARSETNTTKKYQQNSSASTTSLQTALLDIGDRSEQAIDDLSAATLRAMLLDGDRQAARKPRKILYSLLDLQQRQIIRERASKYAAALERLGNYDATAQKSYSQQMQQQQQQQQQKQNEHCPTTQISGLKASACKNALKHASSILSIQDGDGQVVPMCSASLSSPFARPLQLSSLQTSRKTNVQQRKHSWVPKPVDWQLLYSEYHCLLENWRAGRCRVDRWESAHQESIYTLEFDQRNRLFTGSRDNSVKVWHLSETGSQLTPLATLRGHTGSVLTLHAQENVLITGSSDADVCVWSTDTYTIKQRLGHPDAVLSLRFNDRWLATACKDGVVRVWRRKQQAFVDPFELEGHAVAINAVHLHENTLVSASGDRTIRVWDLATRSCTMTLAEHARGVACVDYDGVYIVSGSSDRSIRIWNAATGQCERTINNAHSDLVRTVMFNRGMDVMVSGSYDETIKIWRLSTGALIHKIKNVHTSRVFKLMFDRSRIVSCSHDRSISIIDFAAELPHARLLL